MTRLLTAAFAALLFAFGITNAAAQGAKGTAAEATAMVVAAYAELISSRPATGRR